MRKAACERALDCSRSRSSSVRALLPAFYVSPDFGSPTNTSQATPSSLVDRASVARFTRPRFAIEPREGANGRLQQS